MHAAADSSEQTYTCSCLKEGAESRSFFKGATNKNLSSHPCIYGIKCTYLYDFESLLVVHQQPILCIKPIIDGKSGELTSDWLESRYSCM